MNDTQQLDLLYQAYIQCDNDDELRCVRAARFIYNNIPVAKLAAADVANLRMLEKYGLIPKEELVDGATYLGYCRNATEAVWLAGSNAFEYQRYKWGTTYLEEAPHPVDDRGYDVFVPTKLDMNPRGGHIKVV